ncbi:MAG: LytTR family DNA-binding domain-containing protein, partial [Janthinobacterium sp.]
LAEKITAKPTYLQWIQASIGQDLRMIPVEEILFFRSDEKYTCVQTAKYEALIRKPVRDLAEELDPSLFWQIHRATLVNVNAIEGVTRDIRGRHLVLIKGKSDKLEVSRSFLHLFKQM